MYPALDIGDIVMAVEKDPGAIKVGIKNGDILILKGPRYFYENGVDPIIWNDLPPDFPIIHRAINRKKIGACWYFQTKGDNNWAPDGSFQLKKKEARCLSIIYDSKKPIFIPETEILGVVIKKIPYYGEKRLECKSEKFLINIQKYKKIEVNVYMD